MRNVFFLSLIIVCILANPMAFAGSPSLMTFQSKIISPTGVALEAASVNFRFTTLDSAGTCVLFVEDFTNVNMTGSQGIAAFPLGSGTKVYPPTATNLYEVFNNTATFNCQAGGTSSPAGTDNRQVVMQFNDGSGWQTLPQMAINAVPFANYATRAESLGAYVASDYLRPTTLPTCTAGQALTWNGTTFTCTATGGGGSTYTGVTSIANASGDITLASASGTGAVLVTSNTASTSTTTGAVVITGGVGISGAINTGGNITTLGSISSAGSMLAVTSVFTPQLYGTSTPSGNILIDGTSNAAKGNVLLAATGGNVGIGTTTPGYALSVSGDANVAGKIYSSGRIGIGTQAPNYTLHVVSDVDISAPFPRGAIQVDSEGNNIATFSSRTASSGATPRPAFRGHHSRGTLAAPTSLMAGDGLLGLEALGYDGSGWNWSSTVVMQASENWGPANHGSEIAFYTTPNGTSSSVAHMLIANNGNVGIGTTSPAYALAVSGDVNVTGNFRVNGAVLTGGGATQTGVTSISNSSGDITLTPAVGTGAVQINSGSASTSPTTGALIVSGGIGVSGGVYTGGAISSGSTVSAVTSMFTPQLYGTSTPSGNILIDGTSNATKGNIILAGTGGNVGIGTANPVSTLDVNGGITSGIVDTYGNNSGFITTTLILNNAGIANGTGSQMLFRSNSSVYNLRSVAAIGSETTDSTDTAEKADIYFNAISNGVLSEKLRIKSNGNVGIGTTTPAALLEVSKSQNAATNIYITNSNAGAGASSNSINISDSGSLMTGIASSAGGGNAYVWNFTNSALLIGTNSLERMRVQADGKVGIGTIAPLAPLHVKGAIEMEYGNINAYSAQAVFAPYGFPSNFIHTINTSHSNTVLANNAMKFSLSDLSGVATTDILTLQGTGNVGVGTTSPQAALDVVSTGTSSAIIVPRATTGNRPTTLVNGMIRYNTTSALFEFYQNGGWVNYTTVSDGRLKTNVIPVSQGLNIINQLNPVFFDWDQNNPRAQGFGTQHQVGFIAQEVENVLPEVVNKGEDSYRSVEYGKIVSVVVAAVKELYTKVLDMEATKDREIASVKAEAEVEKVAKDKEIAELKVKVQKAEQENAAMKARLNKIEKMLKLK